MKYLIIVFDDSKKIQYIVYDEMTSPSKILYNYFSCYY